MLLSLVAGERLSWLQALGIVAILIGVVLAAAGHHAEETPDAAASGPDGNTASHSEEGRTREHSPGEDEARVRQLEGARQALPPGVGWALLAALGLGLTFWMLGFLLTPDLGQLVPIWLFRLVGFILLIPLTRLRRESLSLPTGSSLSLVIGIGLLDTGAFVASALGFATGNVAIVSVLASLYSAVAVLLAALFLHERLQPLQWLGIIILLAGVVLTHV